ncbi:MAG TPA: VOC family protein [Vicinamibacterales bacterium]|nr:VOC family protein [Vicinamibacterales bacterium]
MTDLLGLFEAHLTVADLDRSIAFYRDVVRLDVAHVVRDRGAAFFWIGGRGRSMLGLWRGGDGPQHTSLHLAFSAPLAGVLESPRTLRAAGVTPLDFDGQPTDAPSVLAWMPAASIYFRDPDGHLLEYLAMLSDPPQPDRGVVRWGDW